MISWVCKTIDNRHKTKWTRWKRSHYIPVNHIKYVFSVEQNNIQTGPFADQWSYRRRWRPTHSFFCCLKIWYYISANVYRTIEIDSDFPIIYRLLYSYNFWKKNYYWASKMCAANLFPHHWCEYHLGKCLPHSNKLHTTSPHPSTRHCLYFTQCSQRLLLLCGRQYLVFVFTVARRTQMENTSIPC